MKNNGRQVLHVMIALAVALVIWLVVDYDRAETSVSNRPTKIVENVPVEFIGEETVLAGRGLMRIADEEPPTVTLELRGKRWDLAKLDAKAMKVQVNLSSITDKGTQSLSYTPVFPDDNSARYISVVGQKPTAIAVSIGKLYSKEVEIVADIKGDVAEGYIAGEPQFDPGTLKLWGKQSEVMLVEKAKVTLDNTNVNATVVELLDYELYDYNGNLVENPNIHATTDKIQVTLPVEMQKELPLRILLEESAGVRLSNVEYSISPVSIPVTGDAGILGSVDSITLNKVPIVLGELDGDENFSFPIELPKGCVNGSDITEAIVSVHFKDLTSRQITTSDLQYENPPTGKTITILSNDLTITLRGTTADLTAILPTDITVTADLSQVENASGNYTVPAKITVGNGYDVGVVGTYQMKINISEEIAEEPPAEDEQA